MRRTAVSLALALLAIGPALAQPAPDVDPIGALLDRPVDRPGQPTPEMEEPDLASEPRELVPPPTISLPTGPVPYSPPPARPTLTAPVNITERGVTPDSAPTINDLAYESRIRSSMASAQGFQGPLDGAWTLSSAGGDLFAFQLVDKGRGVVEGAWRDLRREGAVGASGFVDQIDAYGGQVTLRFTAGGQGPVAASLRSGGAAWTGEIEVGGRRQSASLRRRN